MTDSLIPLNDLGRHNAAIDPVVRAAINRVLSSHWYILGQECRLFEEEFANYCGVGHCVSVANGTDAIEIGLRAVGVSRGDQVATTANAGFYTSSALAAIGAQAVFIDVDEATHLMDILRLEAVIRSTNLRAIVLTHLYGLLHEMPIFISLAKKHSVPILEDCAQSHGASLQGRRAGSFGDIASFSFYPTKNLGAIGDAGAIVTNDAEIANASRQLRQYGWQNKYNCATPGGRNSRLDELQAAVLRDKLRLLDGWNARRRQIASIYRETIKHPYVQIPDNDTERHVYHLFVVVSENRSALQTHLKSLGIMTDIHYPIADHRQSAYLGQHHGRAFSLPVTEFLCDHVLTLPCYPEMSDTEALRVAAAVNHW